MWYWFTNWFVKCTGYIPWVLACRPKHYYEDKKVQSRRIKGKAVLISNHRSIYDMGAMLVTFPGRTLRHVTAEVMYQKNFLMTLFLKAIGCIKVNRHRQDYKFIKRSHKILQKGGVVEIYPEARLPKKGEATPLPFKPSAVYIALESGAPIIPVYTNGKYFCKERQRVIIGKPVYANDLYDDSLSKKENCEKISEHLRERIIELEHELERQTTQEKEKKAKKNR